MALLANLNYNVSYRIELFTKKRNELFLVRKDYFIQCQTIFDNFFHTDNFCVFKKKSTYRAVKSAI